MKIHRLYIFIAFLLLSIFICVVKNSLSRDYHPKNAPNEIHHKETTFILSNQIENNSHIKLIQPDSASQVNTFTPTFTWRAVKAKRLVEYRLLIAKIDGKIIFDQWVGQDTSYTISAANYFEDLNPYYWTIYASYDDRQVQSPVWSFWVDQDVVTDLTVSNIVLEQEKSSWNPGDEVKIAVIVQNSGPINAEGCIVTLYNGNINQNYFNYAALRKTIALDTVFIPALKMNDPQTITLRARLPYGLNHFFVRIDPAAGMKDVIYSNNFSKGITIQTEDRLLSIKCLFIIYKNYFDPEAGEKRLNENDLDTLNNNIINLQRYFWDHTNIIQFQVDTLLFDRMLTDKNFTYQDNQWGYFLSPVEVNADLVWRNINESGYDLVFVYYSWWNSKSSWSGYSGYTLKDAKLFNGKLPFLAQPVTTGHIENEKTAIHEFLHLLENQYEENGEHQFYSPHHRVLYTTFDKDEDYFDWILETWPTNKWFNLKIGQTVSRNDVTWMFEPTKISDEPKRLILSQNYPNPFNKITTIIYKVPQFNLSSTGVRVRLVIYDLLGNQVRTLVNTIQKPGTFRVYWDGKNQKGHIISSGIYFYEIKANEQRQVKKLLYIR
jgi:hypothetical protein